MRMNMLMFDWTIDGDLALEDIVQAVAKQHGKKRRWGGYDRMPFMEERDDYVRGLLLTVKDQKRFCEMQSKGDGLKLKVRKLAEDSDLVDFNFFIIHKKTLRGAYLGYHNSCSVRQFGNFFFSFHHDLLRDRNRVLREAGDEERLKGEFECTPIVRRGKIDEFLKEYPKILTFQFDTKEIGEDESWLRPHSNDIRLVRRVIKFSADGAITRIRKFIKETVAEAEPEAGQVEVKDSDDVLRRIKLFENMDALKDFDFDELASGVAFDLKKFADAGIFELMFEAIGTNKRFFEAKAAN